MSMKIIDFCSTYNNTDSSCDRYVKIIMFYKIIYVIKKFLFAVHIIIQIQIVTTCYRLIIFYKIIYAIKKLNFALTYNSIDSSCTECKTDYVL